MKFDVVARFRETIPMVKSFCHSRSKKISDFYRNDNFTLFSKIGIFSGLTKMIAIEPQLKKKSMNRLGGSF